MKARRTPLVLALALCLSFFLPDLARTQGGGGEAALAGNVQRLVDEAGLGERVGIEIRDAATGREVFRLRPDLPLNPASNMKVATAAAALLVLGPEFTMRTGLYGRIESGTVADLVLKGQGDPSLEESDLVALAEALADRGVRSVERIHVDGSYFDGQILPPAFDQQPNEIAYFRAAVGAVSVDKSSFVLRVLPGAEVGARAQVRLHGEGYFEVTNQISTSEGGEPNIVATQAPIAGDRMALRLSGSIPAGVLGVSYRRRIENPLAHAGYVLAEALGRVGIRGTRTVRVGALPQALPLLAEHESEPLAELLSDVGKHSDNFVAEMVLKVLGAERQVPGSSARGAEVVQEVLGQAGVPRGAATIVNGSGLFQGNRIAASHLARILVHVYRTPAVRNEYLSQLAIGGVDGTLARRLTGLPVRRIVRAKTGTLNDVISLSGYVLGPDPSKAYAFSFLANGVAGKQSQARELADRIVSELVTALYPNGH
ncbi:MAG: D-alanyl-D-alanine carboxypeptidase/D-alanyl-D-alanine-endopeptidase [Polyangiales bacterium]